MAEQLTITVDEMDSWIQEHSEDKEPLLTSDLMGQLSSVVGDMLQNKGFYLRADILHYPRPTPIAITAVECCFNLVDTAYKLDDPIADYIWRHALKLGGDDDVDYNSSYPSMLWSYLKEMHKK